MDDLLQEFLSETAESLAVLDVELVRFERESSDATILSNIFRLMHTIKGTCGFLGLPRLGAVAHAGENILGKFRDGELEVTPRAVTLILKAIDQIRVLLAEMETTGAEPAGNDAMLIDEINAVASGGAAAAPTPAMPESSAEGPAFSDGGFPVAAELLAEVAHALKHEPVAAMPETPATAPEPAPEPVRAAEPARSPEPVARAPEPAAPRETETKEPSNSSIRVNVDVIENLMTLISELVLTRNQLLQMQRGQKDNEFKVPLQRLSHITSDLQDGVTRMRMQPIGNAWNKLPRIVRDLTVATGKKIVLTMQGADTELDRQVLEMIKDPLTHMVRNSADHGIEDGVTRLAAGKPETGTIALNAYHESGHIFIRIADDGKGLDLERIRQKAITNGLATEAAIAGMGEQQILQFIFRPGFSTAEKVTSVSGRGVGMDVVRTNIERIGGTIELSSVAGKGTTFLIKIPLTLAIVSALIVEANSQRFAIPQLNVVELVGVSDRSEARIETINTSPVLRLRDRLLPLVSLRGVLGLETGTKTTDRFVIVAQVGANTFGIIVDRVFDTEEIVVKPVAPLLRGTPFYVGNTILGDGSVIMILDPNGLSQAAGQIESQDAASAQNKAARASNHGTDAASFLLFRTAGAELKAIPLELVSRIEGLDAGTIEHVGGRHVVQYRDHLMPLVPFDDGHSWKENGQQETLVFSDNGRSMGLAVDEVVDIVRDRMAIELSSARPGLLGSAIIAGKAVDIVDVGHFLTQAFADWFEITAAHSMARHALLVDDSPFFRNLVAPLLTSANWKVTTAADGVEALKLREAGHQFDVIISDIEMPNLDGLALANAIRNDPRWNKVPLIALSSHAEESDIQAGQQAGFDEYLAKSDQTRLTENLARVLRLAGRGETNDNLRRAS